MFDLKEYASLPIFRNSLTAWLIAGAVALAVASAMWLARAAIRRYHQKLLKTERTELLEIPAEVLGRTTGLFIVIVALVLALETLETGPTSVKFISTVMTIGMFWQAGVWAAAAASGWLTRKRQQSMQGDRASASSLNIIGFLLSAVIWALVLLLTLENLGVNITALVAGLGIGGVAVALALQNVLGDLFASLAITLDRPFVVGDFLSVGDLLGAVEYIGIKTTRLRSLGGEQIVMSNSDLLGSRVRNYGRMRERRVVFAIGVTYETPVELLERIPHFIREIVEAQKETRFDRSHFQKHGAASLDFETVYFVLSSDFNKYMDIQQTINLALHRKFAQQDIEFAYPTQRLLVERIDSSSPNPG